MGNHGVKVAQSRYNVVTAADWQLLYNSSWPVLPIAHIETFSIADATVDQVLYTHGLPYTPKFLIFLDSPYLDSSQQSAGNLRLVGAGTAQYFGMNNTNLRWLGSTRSAPAGTLTGHLVIFQSDMVASYTAPNINTTQASEISASGNAGFKLAKEGQSAFSTDLRDFVVHSGAKSPLIHKMGSGSFGPGGGSVGITHNLGYSPRYYVWANITGFASDRYQMVTTADDSVVTSTSTTATLSIFSECSYSYLLLKDPLLL